MFSAILILLIMPFTDLSRSRGTQFKPLSKAAFFIFVGNFLILMELGAKHVESPFIEFGQICTVIYFAHFLIIVPLISLLENSLIELASKENAISDSLLRANTLSLPFPNTLAMFFSNIHPLPLSVPFTQAPQPNPKLRVVYMLTSITVLLPLVIYILYNFYNFNLTKSDMLYCDAPRP